MVHAPLWHESTPLQNRPSSQLVPSARFACAQPVAGTQLSAVQTFPSLQISAGPPTQTPPEQVSLVVQALLSVHTTLLLVCVQPVPALHPSVVQMFPSLQSGGGPPAQDPPEQVSTVVHAFPSLHGELLSAKRQPVAGTHESVVQVFESLQTRGGPPTQAPPEHTSAVVQAFPSLQPAVLLAWVQPDPGLHPSVVQTLPSSQSGGAPPMHEPPLHVSLVVQAFPSLQDAVLLAYTQPVAGAHESLVQTFPSSQIGAPLPTQTPDWQTSVTVHALPSLQGIELSV